MSELADHEYISLEIRELSKPEYERDEVIHIVFNISTEEMELVSKRLKRIEEIREGLVIYPGKNMNQLLLDEIYTNESKCVNDELIVIAGNYETEQVVFDFTNPNGAVISEKMTVFHTKDQAGKKYYLVNKDGKVIALNEDLYRLRIHANQSKGFREKNNARFIMPRVNSYGEIDGVINILNMSMVNQSEYTK